jgi:CubicO group peptidase (beta-lactamase class C family)
MPKLARTLPGNPTLLGLSLSLLFLVGAACSDPSSPEARSYPAPEATGDGWITATPEEVGMDPGPLVEMKEWLEERDGHFIHSILVVRNGTLVFEEYFPGEQFDLVDGSPDDLHPVAFDRNTLQFQGSVTKSVVSALVGIALDQGLIPDTGVPVFPFFPDYAELSTPEKGTVTLEHLLTMKAGWPWFDDDIDGSGSDERAMFLHSDPLRFILERPLSWEPGTRMEYHSGYAVLLGEVVARASGVDLATFARERLFEPLGITDGSWATCPNSPGVVFAGGGLYLRPRDMAKIGQLFLQGGVWEGEEVLSRGWTERSVALSAPSEERFGSHYRQTGYGFMWWLGRWDGGYDAYLAAGFGGQFIIVIPEASLVVVVTGGNYEANGMGAPVPFSVWDDIVFGSILPALGG